MKHSFKTFLLQAQHGPDFKGLRRENARFCTDINAKRRTTGRKEQIWREDEHVTSLTALVAVNSFQTALPMLRDLAPFPRLADAVTIQVQRCAGETSAHAVHAPASTWCHGVVQGSCLGREISVSTSGTA